MLLSYKKSRYDIITNSLQFILLTLLGESIELFYSQGNVFNNIASKHSKFFSLTSTVLKLIHGLFGHVGVAARVGNKIVLKQRK